MASNNMNVILYIHGKDGSAAESEHYKSLFPQDAVLGLDYQTFTPWETGKEIRISAKKLKSQYENPVLRWNMDNIFIRTDPAGNIKADKAKSTEKIDGAIALIMALDRAIRCGNESIGSVYNNRGILVI